MTGNAAFILNLGGGVDPSVVKYRGTLGTGGTISSLPEASEQNQGDSYIVITDGTYAGQTAVAGDAFISNGENWTKLPSGDDPALLQAITMPEPSNYLNGKIIQYIGDTNSNYVNGVIYKCQVNDNGTVTKIFDVTEDLTEEQRTIRFTNSQTIVLAHMNAGGQYGPYEANYYETEDSTATNVSELYYQQTGTYYANGVPFELEVVAGSKIVFPNIHSSTDTYYNKTYGIRYNNGAYIWKPIDGYDYRLLNTNFSNCKDIIIQYDGNSTDYKKGHFYKYSQSENIVTKEIQHATGSRTYDTTYYYFTGHNSNTVTISANIVGTGTYDRCAWQVFRLTNAGSNPRISGFLRNETPSQTIELLPNEILVFNNLDTGTNHTITYSETGQLAWRELSVCDYEGMTNKPQINGVTLLGNKDTEDLKIDRFLTQAEYDALPDSKLTDNVNYFISDGQSGTIRYNAETDTIQIFDGTTWHNWKLGGLQGVDINDLDYTDWSYIGKGTLVSTYNYASKPLSASAYTDGAGSGYGSGIRIQTASAIDLTGMNYLRIIGSCANVGTNATIKDSYADTALALVQDVTGTVTQLKKFTVNGNFSEIIPVGVTGKYKIRLDCGAMPMTTGSIVFNTIKFTANNPG